MLEEITTPALKCPTSEALENEDNHQTKAFDGEISDIKSSLWKQTNTHKQKKLTKEDYNNYKINDKPFDVYDDRKKFDDK